MFVVPFMTRVLKIQDTTIILLALTSTTTGVFLKTFNSSEWVLYFCNVLYSLHWSITTISRCCISKLISANEIGRAFTVLAVLESVFPLLTKPFNAFLYQKTLSTFPGAFIALAGCSYFVVFLIQLYTHFGLKTRKKNSHDIPNLEVKD